LFSFQTVITKVVGVKFFETRTVYRPISLFNYIHQVAHDEFYLEKEVSITWIFQRVASNDSDYDHAVFTGEFTGSSFFMVNVGAKFQREQRERSRPMREG